MTDLNIIDRFMDAFIRYIDSGFGLLGGDVAFLTSVLIGIDITLAGLFWAMGGEDDVLGRLAKKILYVGAFAFIINRFQLLADIILKSFAQAGLTASGGGMAAADLLKPGRLAGAGFEAAHPLLEQIAELLGFTSFFDNFLTIVVLLIAWAIVIAAFFILAIQMFVTIIEFKLTTLAGFILIPFALWNRTAFLAERVLGNVVASGIKVMVLAVIVGIGAGFLDEFRTALNGTEPNIVSAFALVLASLTLFGLGIFGPGIASGLVAGAPQLGAGAAIGTAAGAAGGAMLAVGGAAALARGASAGVSAIRAGAAMGTASGGAAGAGPGPGSGSGFGSGTSLPGSTPPGGGGPTSAAPATPATSPASAASTPATSAPAASAATATAGPESGAPTSVTAPPDPSSSVASPSSPPALSLAPEGSPSPFPDAAQSSGPSAAAEPGNASAQSAAPASSQSVPSSPAPSASLAAPTADASATTPPPWAARLRAEQTARHRGQLAYQAIKEGDRGGASATPDISEREDRS